MWTLMKEWRFCIVDIKERIQEMNRARGWTIYRLAKEAGIAPSTLTNMINRGTSPSLATLERLCMAYDMTLVQFFYDDEETVALTEEQRRHLEVWDRLSRRQKKAVDLFMEGLMQVD